MEDPEVFRRIFERRREVLEVYRDLLATRAVDLARPPPPDGDETALDRINAHMELVFQLARYAMAVKGVRAAFERPVSLRVYSNDIFADRMQFARPGEEDESAIVKIMNHITNHCALHRYRRCHGAVFQENWWSA
eukprot:tig00000492_g1446.t1